MRAVVFVAMLLLPARIALAVNCATYPDSEGLTCVMSDGTTQGACNNLVCIRTYTIPGNGARTGTGTISSSGATVTGSGTAFTSELHVGDLFGASSQTVTITAIASGTSLTVYPTFSSNLPGGTTFTYTNPIVRYLDSSGNAVGQWDQRGTAIIGPNLNITIGPTSIAGALSSGLTIHGALSPGGLGSGDAIKLDDPVFLRPGLAQFSGPIGNPTVAVDFANALAPASGSKEFALVFYHPNVTMSADNADVEVIKDTATYTSNASTTNSEGVQPIFIGSKATSATAGHPPVPVVPLVNQCIVESNGVDNSTTHATGENTVLHQPTYQVLGVGAKLVADDDVAVISQPLFYTDTTGQVLTVGHRAVVWAKAPLFTGIGPNATITTDPLIDLEDQTATGITYTNPPVGFANKGPNLLKQTGKSRFGDQANPNEQVEVLGNVLVDNAGTENGVKLKGTSTGVVTVKGGSTDTRNATLVLSPGLMAFAQANAGGM